MAKPETLSTQQELLVGKSSTNDAPDSPCLLSFGKVNKSEGPSRSEVVVGTNLKIEDDEKKVEEKSEIPKTDTTSTKAIESKSDTKTQKKVLTDLPLHGFMLYFLENRARAGAAAKLHRKATGKVLLEEITPKPEAEAEAAAVSGSKEGVKGKKKRRNRTQERRSNAERNKEDIEIGIRLGLEWLRLPEVEKNKFSERIAEMKNKEKKTKNKDEELKKKDIIDSKVIKEKQVDSVLLDDNILHNTSMGEEKISIVNTEKLNDTKYVFSHEFQI